MIGLNALGCACIVCLVHLTSASSQALHNSRAWYALALNGLLAAAGSCFALLYYVSVSVFSLSHGDASARVLALLNAAGIGLLLAGGTTAFRRRRRGRAGFGFGFAAAGVAIVVVAVVDHRRRRQRHAHAHRGLKRGLGLRGLGGVRGVLVLFPLRLLEGHERADVLELEVGAPAVGEEAERARAGDAADVHVRQLRVDAEARVHRLFGFHEILYII